ncbi:MAG: RibD family protein [Hyphomonadaceae bacterium]
MSASPANSVHVTLKLATSLDGRIAAASGESRWITGPEARLEVHKLRAAADAVLTGSGTAVADDPELTARLPAPAPRQPLRVVLDTRLRLPVRSRLIATLDQAPLLVIGAAGAVTLAARAKLEKSGAETALVAPAGPHGGVDLQAALGFLAEARGVRRVLVEAGGRLAAAFIAAGLVNRLEWFRAPILLGGDGRPVIEALRLQRLSEAAAFRRLALREIGADLWETYEPA